MTHLLCTSLADHVYNLPHSGTPNNAVIHQQHTLALENSWHGIQLPLDSQFPGALIWHDEGSAHISILYQTLSVREPQLVGNLNGCWTGAIWDWDYTVNVPVGLSASSR